jgi:hypothetical protein
MRKAISEKNCVKIEKLVANCVRRVQIKCYQSVGIAEKSVIFAVLTFFLNRKTER